jgi:tetratricopeptide (TPR) repeat protein
MTVAFDALASLYLEGLDYEKLSAAARRYLDSSPSDYRGYYYLAASHENSRDDVPKAEQLLRTAIRLNPGFAASHALLGKVLVSQGRAEEAIGTLQRAIQLRPDYVPAHLYLGNAYTKLGRKSEASREIQIVRELNDKQTRQPSLLYHRGTATSK